MVAPEQRDSHEAFRVNELHVDPALGFVVGPLGRAHLEPRVLAVLQALARRPGKLVSRDELLSDIWPGSAVYDEALTQCVYQLRQQLISAGGADQRDLIRTVPKRGYVLGGEVRPIEDESPDVKAPAMPGNGDVRETAAAAPLSENPGAHGRESSHGGGGRRAGSGLLSVVLVAVLLAIGAWSLQTWRNGKEPALPVGPAGGTETLAVLPFLPLAEESRDPVLELGMADTLIARLSGIEQIVVRPITSVRRYTGMDRDTLRAGRDLGADIVLEGSIQRAGETLRVNTRLLRVSDGAALWADTFEARSANIFDIQDAICERIASALALEIGQRPARTGTADVQAYEHYLEGRYGLARFSLRELRASIEAFRSAVASDPGYAEAWLGLANVQFRIGVAGEVPPDEVRENARAAARRALAIDPTLAEGHAMLGWIAQWYDWDWAASEAHFLRAIELDASETESHLGYGHLLYVTGRYDQALAEGRRAREVSPFYPLAASLEGMFLVGARRTDEAVTRLEAARQLNGNFWLIRLHLAEAYLAADRFEDALREVRIARELSGGSSIARAREIGSLARLGRTAEAEDLLADLVRLAGEQYVPPVDVALAFDGIGDGDGALSWLERGYDGRDTKMALLGVFEWRSIRDRSEFSSLLKRMNLARREIDP